MPAQVREEAGAKLRRFCDKVLALHNGEEYRLEFTFRGMSATLFEFRPPWAPHVLGPEWTKIPIAQFRYDPGTAIWTLYWADRNSRWREDFESNPSSKLDDLLADVEEDPTGVYWG